MLQIPDKARLEVINTRLKAHDVRFPVAAIVDRTGEDKGNVSKMLKGKKPISDNFYTTFLKAFPEIDNSGGGQKGGYSQPLPLGDINITVADYIQMVNEKARLAHEYASTMKQLMENKVVVSLDSMKGNLGDLHTMITAGLQLVAETQATVEGVPVEVVLDRINRVAAVVHAAKKKDIPASSPHKGAKPSKKKEKT